MEFLLGIVGKDFVLTVTDPMVSRSITVMKSDADKSRQLSSNCHMVFSGEAGDTISFSEYIQANVRLYSIRNQVDLSTRGTANFIRGSLAESLRSRSPYQVNLLVAGVDPKAPEGEQAGLYWIDYLATLAKCPFASHGYGSFYCMSLLDRYHKPDMTLDEVKALARLCAEEMRRRFIVNLGDFVCKVVDKDGIREIPLFD
ncbi:nucleophile aminohydrolase [Syncephalis plumigaleata]|nr:nucleophile aminohydrolase [Syncephalis plumigaleata]